MEVFLTAFFAIVIFSTIVITLSEKISKKMSPGFKSACIIAMLGIITASSLYTFKMIKDYKGIPVYVSSLGEWAAPDNRVIIKGQFVDQNLEKIFLMINKYEKHKEEPVYIWTDFSEALQEALAEGQEQFEGQPFSMEVSEEGQGEGKEKGKGKKEGENSENGKEGPEGMSHMSEAYKIGPMPAPLLPSKLKAEDNGQ